jgi:hypothetical protein
LAGSIQSISNFMVCPLPHPGNGLFNRFDPIDLVRHVNPPSLFPVRSLAHPGNGRLGRLDPIDLKSHRDPPQIPSCLYGAGHGGTGLQLCRPRRAGLHLRSGLAHPGDGLFGRLDPVDLAVHGTPPIPLDSWSAALPAHAQRTPLCPVYLAAARRVLHVVGATPLSRSRAGPWTPRY